MVRAIYARNGFSLIEILTSTVITMLVIGGALAIYIMSITAWKEGGVQTALQRQASIAMEKMVRGVEGRHGIREASNPVERYSSNTEIRYTSGIDNVTRRFYLSSGEIWYDPDTSPGGGERIAENVTGLTFPVSGSSDIVIIDLNMGKQVKDKMISIDLSTQVTLRN